MRNFTYTLFVSLGLSLSMHAQTIVTISFDDPSMMPTTCFTIFTEEGIPQQLINNGNSCSFDYYGGQLGLFPATLSVDLSSLGSVAQVEVDINDFCGSGCSEAALLDNGNVVLSTSNTMVGSPETLQLDNLGLMAVDELQLSSFEAFFFEIRITHLQSDPCNGTGDSDNDSVCDALDICPGFDDNIDRDGNGVPDYCDFCDVNRTLIEPNQAGEFLVYQAIEQITSGQVIQSGADITFSAPVSVNLIAGFEVEFGAVFNAITEGCIFPTVN